MTELKKLESIILTQTHIFCKQVTAGIEVNPLTDAGFKAKFANGIVIPNNYEITRLVSSLKYESSLNHLCSLKTSSTQIKQSQKKLQKPPYFQKQTIMTSTMQEQWHCQHCQYFCCQNNVSKSSDASLTCLQIKSYTFTVFPTNSSSSTSFTNQHSPRCFIM